MVRRGRGARRPGPALQARGLAFDPDGDLFVADSGNGRLRRITPGGTIQSTADGRRQGTLDRDFRPQAVAFGPDGSRYVVVNEAWNYVRRVDADGVTWPFAGTGT